MSALTPARLGKEITAFLVFKRALGHPYRRGEATLRNFERFALDGRGTRSRIYMEPTIRAWLLRSPGRKPVTLADDLGAVRQCCLYLRRSDPTAFVPPVSLAPQTESHYVPYVFSLEEIRQLIKAAEGRIRNFVCEPVDKLTRSARIVQRTESPVAPWQHAMRWADVAISR